MPLHICDVAQDADAQGGSNDNAQCNAEEPCRAERDGTGSATPSSRAPEALVREFVPYRRITAFAWSVIRHVVPAVSTNTLDSLISAQSPQAECKC